MSEIKMSRRYLDGNYKEILKFIENELTETQKCYIIMYYRDGLTIREIARRCEVNPSTVSRTVRRASDKIKRTVATARRLCG